MRQGFVRSASKQAHLTERPSPNPPLVESCPLPSAFPTGGNQSLEIRMSDEHLISPSSHSALPTPFQGLIPFRKPVPKSSLLPDPDGIGLPCPLREINGANCSCFERGESADSRFTKLRPPKSPLLTEYSASQGLGSRPI